MQRGADTKAGGANWRIRINGTAMKGSAGNVHMRPRYFMYKMLQEKTGGYGTSYMILSNILNIRYIVFNVFVIFFYQRQFTQHLT